jgi:hypothetical protein
MPCKYLIITWSLIIICLFTACKVYNELDPLKDDTVENFETSKFEGFWQVQNPAWNLDHPPMLYIFKKNTVQRFAGTRDWDNNGELSEINTGWEADKFKYSDTIIYTYEFIDYMAWIKNYYELSADGKKLKFGRYYLEKLDVEPWTKENLLGSWYIDVSENTIIMYTFNENALAVQAYTNEIPDNNYSHANIDITLTDESFTYGPITTCYYHIINDKLFLSNGSILIRY